MPKSVFGIFFIYNDSEKYSEHGGLQSEQKIYQYIAYIIYGCHTAADYGNIGSRDVQFKWQFNVNIQGCSENQ